MTDQTKPIENKLKKTLVDAKTRFPHAKKMQRPDIIKIRAKIANN